MVNDRTTEKMNKALLSLMIAALAVINGAAQAPNSAALLSDSVAEVAK